MLIEVAYGRMSPDSLEAEAEQGDDEEYDAPQEYENLRPATTKTTKRIRIATSDWSVSIRPGALHFAG